MKRNIVKSESYTHEFIRLSESELFFSRSQKYQINNFEIDCYGDFWSFICADLPEKGLMIIEQQDSHLLSGKIGLLLPKHSIVQWKFLTKKVKWSTFSSIKEYPNEFPLSPQVFSLKKLPEFLNEDKVKALIKQADPLFELNCSSENNYSRNLKKIIDANYMINQPMDQFAKTLNLSKEWLIKYFKKSYGITPIAYRNKKRLMQAFILLHLNDSKILDLSHTVGFNDLKQFNDLFKQNIHTTPSKFLISKQRR